MVIEPRSYQATLSAAFGTAFWPLIRGKRVLDFGCGEGGFVIGMATKVACYAEGVDIQDQFQVAKRYAAMAGITNVQFHLGRSEGLEGAGYDVVISHDSFEHFEEPEMVLDEMVRLVKPGGHVFIKFGPAWMSPYGRHMSGTFKKSRPWIHLFVPERHMMRVHSVYHNDTELYTRYADLIGGLNKMTLKRAKGIIGSHPELNIVTQHVMPWRGMSFFLKFPVLKELFGAAVCFKCVKIK
ncbi:hypothetical protein GCM10022395_21660 [Snuella lapsa]|uniref:Methyltransferase domain-containing protein n=1 Tax=Snuella lapsa TaxID=870481 RepID=A0ABP6XY88_9FLAO